MTAPGTPPGAGGGGPVRAVVVGGASGIGAAVAAHQRAAGADVVVWDRAQGADVHCDVADPRQVEAAVAATLDGLGVPTVVTVTAGIGHGGMLLDVPPADWEEVVGVNARGTWLVLRGLARPMLEAGGGSMVATGSVSGRLADRGMGLYCISKAAVDMVVKVAAAEWAPTLRVNAVAPGVTDTALIGPAPRTGPWLAGVAARTPMGRLGTVDDIAEAVVAVHALGWVTGQTVVCDGGLTLHSPIEPLGPRRG